MLYDLSPNAIYIYIAILVCATLIILRNKITARQFLQFLIGSSFSILVLLMLVVLLVSLNQGMTIILNLFWDPWNMFLTIMSIGFLALIISHYPDYIITALGDYKGKNFIWKRKSLLVYYEKKNLKFKSNDYIGFFRRQLGLATHLMWIYALVATTDKIRPDSVPVLAVMFVLVLIFIGLAYCLEIVRKKNDTMDENKRPYAKYLVGFNVLVVLNVVVLFTLLILICLKNLTLLSLSLAFLSGLLSTLLYIYFRIFRSWFHRFTFSIKKKEGYVRTFLPFHRLEETTDYLTVIAIVGVLLYSLVFGVMYYSPYLINKINPLPVFIILISFYYTSLLFIIKNYLYYKYHSANGNKSIKFLGIKTWIFSFLPFSLILFLFATTFIDNSLHTLPTIEEDKALSKLEFINNLKIDASLAGYYVMGAYGGGLKANVWTMNILHELKHHEKGKRLFQSLLCASGTSGGTLGLGCYTMINNHVKTKDTTNQRIFIDSISEMNALSSDISGLLWKDMIREIVLGKYMKEKGNDRANESMQNYSLVVEGEDHKILKNTFRSYWYDVYSKHDNAYPAIIVNTAPTTSKFGVACSVKGFNDFPIMIDILDHGNNAEQKDSSLSFGGAISTSNRFPLFSPAARIEGKGHFVDGGYFENSGLMNAYHFYEQIKYELPKNKKRDSLFVINIVNDQTNYILNNDSIANFMKSVKRKEPASAEYSSMIGGIAALERMPNFMREKIDKDPTAELLNIHMPFYIHKENVLKAFHMTNELGGRLDTIISHQNNLIIKALIDSEEYDYDNWGVVEPPLGRLMSVPAVEYQKAMIKHHDQVKKDIKNILSKIPEE